ncbi:putative polyol transporter 2-like protein 1 [Zalerion maritima]|uniref:Polyol transporter 2-like protein 1 n=1 Tax=Zalerion maritima TaxID=339359 RepID=A0AAD5WNL3_9PEZI|nr:putative polyol transporter 2-like protein 1 [Zalerion maritima]
MAPSKIIPNYLLATVLTSTGALLNGYDTGSIGPSLSMPQFTSSLGPLSPSLLGFTVSLILLTGTLPSFFAGYLADRFGRLPTISAGLFTFFVGCILECSSDSLPQFLLGRALAGLGEGIYLSNIWVYACEIAPVTKRGVMSGIPQFFVAFGICCGYFTCYATVQAMPEGSWAWRTPFLIQGLLGMVGALACLCLPDSPRWYVLRGQRGKAVNALEWLGLPAGETDFMNVGVNGTSEGAHQPSLGYLQSTLLLFRRGYRARTFLALFVLGLIQLSGIDGVLYYAPILFHQAGLSSSTSSFLASGVSAILMLAITIPAFLFADKWGRRTSAITGGIGLSGCMFLIGSLYAAGVVHPYGIARWVVIVCVFVFGLTYCATWAIMGKIYASEIHQPHTRAAANCVAQGLGFFTNWLVAMLTPILLDKSAFGAYFLFGGIALFSVPVLTFYMPETRGRSLESIQEAFHRPTINLGNIPSRVGSLIHRRRGGAATRQNLPPSANRDEIEMTRQHGQVERTTTTTTSSVAPPALRLGITTV